MTLWRNGRLNLGALGYLEIANYSPSPSGKTWWRWYWNESYGATLHMGEDTANLTRQEAQRSAERWLRAALKQAQKRIGP